MKRITLTLLCTGALALSAAAPAGAQTLTPTSANFPPTPFRVMSAPIPFTLTGKTVGFFGISTNVGTTNTYTSGSFFETNNCPDSLKDNETCTINVTFSPYTITPKAKSGVLFAAGLEAPLTGTGYTPSKGKGKKGKKCKKGKGKKAGAAKKKKKKKKCKKK